MIKLESKNSLPSAVARLELKSSSALPSVSLSVEDARENINNQWVTSPTKRVQTVTFIGSDGTPCSIEGTLHEAEAVEIPAAFKVVVDIRVRNELKAAFQAGRVSRAYTSLELVRVVEVWESASKCLWSADKEPTQATREVDMSSGKISKVA